MDIYKKLSKAKAEFSPLLKDSKNPFFKSKYASLNALMDVIEKPFHDNGLLLLQPIQDGMVVTQIMNIDSDEIITSEMRLPDNIDPQKLGSAITYFRRYTLQSLLGLNAQDDDGEAAKPRPKKQEPDWPLIASEFAKAENVDEVKVIWAKYKTLQTEERFINMKNTKKKLL